MIFVIKQITVLPVVLSQPPALSSSPPSLSITVLLLIFFQLQINFFNFIVVSQYFFFPYLWVFMVLNDIKTFYKMTKIWLGSFRKALIT